MVGNLLVLTADDVRTIVDGREEDMIEAVREAYQMHARGCSSLPHSTFLRFPSDLRNRIVSLPAFLGGGEPIAGIKWIASFPDNRNIGLERASAILILNDPCTGMPDTVMEGSIVSAKRTAASAALAASCFIRHLNLDSIGVVGCGRINLEILRFLGLVVPRAKRLILFDIDREQADKMAAKSREFFPDAHQCVAARIEDLLAETDLVSFATTASTPYFGEKRSLRPGSNILHISLRDLAPEVILACDNVVDDVYHVCREQTSVHLAENLVGNRDFIRCTLADILSGNAAPKKDCESVTIFSPFGLGILDLAVGRLVRNAARKDGLGLLIASFLPERLM